MKASSAPNGALRRQLRAIGHHLKPVLLVGNNGLSEGLLQEAARALHDHELIKVKVQAEDREARQTLVRELTTALQADCVQTLGNTALLFRANPQPDPKLSNRLRYGA